MLGVDMCRIAALSVFRPVRLESVMEYFFLPPMPDTYNRDGWGLVCYMGDDCLLIKEPAYARESILLRAVMDGGRLKGCQALFHVRKATKGGVTFANTHPFVKRMWGMCWAFAHHGDGDWPTESFPGPFQPVGRTDAEAIFCWMLNELWRAFGDRAPPWRVIVPKVWELVCRLWRDSRKINFVLCVPSLMLAFYGGHESMYYCHHILEGSDAFLVSSTPLPFTSGWVSFNPGELKVVKKGSIQEGLWDPFSQRGLLE